MIAPRLARLDRRLGAQLFRYGLAGGVAVVTHLAVLMLLVELAASPPTLASLLGFACATVVNYLLQHRFVFVRARGHGAYFPRYVAVTMATMSLNTLLFWGFYDGFGLYYPLSQLITIGIIVPLNFMINRSFTFAEPAAGRGGAPAMRWRRAGSA
jgi:putative flippase GtrA